MHSSLWHYAFVLLLLRVLQQLGTCALALVSPAALSLAHHIFPAGSWARRSALLFIDQPLGTGFSVAGRCG